jgi:hypothetical protein
MPLASTNLKLDVNATTPGRRAIAGFVLQILRSIRLALDMSLTFFSLESGDTRSCRYSRSIASNPAILIVLAWPVSPMKRPGAKAKTEAEFVDNIRAMLDTVLANGIAVVLAGIPPLSHLLPGPDFDMRLWLGSMPGSGNRGRIRRAVGRLLLAAGRIGRLVRPRLYL